MPNSSHEPSASSANLQAYLQDALPDSQLIHAAIDGPYQPLLLLETAHVVAGFAFSNGDMRKSYDALYGSFKKYYAERRGAWDALDLAFVFCVSPDAPNLDRFCSHIETDVYFCRKFVVPLTPSVPDSLARLPFLPLTPLHGQSLRPPSAQTFLQQCGVPAVLAKFLVVPRERSAERIVEDCTSGVFGEPRQLRPALSMPIPRVEHAPESVRFDTVTIKDFRAYRRSQTFRLGADVTVLYGPNGFGKTSFFDAIDFAVTGEIGRLHSSGESHFKNAAKHLDATAEESSVSLSFSSNGAVRRITRKVSDPKQALLDGRVTDRKRILAELTGGEIPAADRVENFVSLFRATHLFSQEHQELARDFRNDCELSGAIVSRLLAFEDYASAANKASKVRQLVHATIVHADKEIRELSEQIADDREQIDRLGQPAHAHSSADALDAAIEAMRRRVSEVGIAVDAESTHMDAVLSWRVSLTAQHAESQRRIARLSDLAKDAGRLTELRAALDGLHETTAVKEQALSSNDQTKTAAERDLQFAEQRLAEALAKRTEAQAHAVRLAWIRATRPAYAQLLKRQRDVARELTRATSALAEQRESSASATSELRLKEEQAEHVSAALDTLRAQLDAVRALNDALPAWYANHDRLAAVSEAEARGSGSLDVLRADAGTLSSQLAALTENENRLARHVAEVDRGQSALRNLLSQLQDHVQSGTCPLCGEDHGSKEALLRRIREHVASDAASGARVELAELRAEISQLSERVANNAQARRTADSNLSQLASERARLVADTDTFERAVVSHGIPIDRHGTTTREQLQERHERLQSDAAELDQQLQACVESLQVARAAQERGRASSEALAGEIAAKETALGDIQSDISGLRENPLVTSVSLDTKAAQLADLERLNGAELAALDADIADAEGDTERTRPQISMLIQERESLEAELQSLRDQRTTLQNVSTGIMARLESAELSADSTEDAVLALIAGVSRSQSRLEELRDAVTSLEVAVDTATAAAALAGLSQNVASKERAVTAAKDTRARHEPWLKYFDALSSLVTSQQNEAIDQFTREYGPRTSVIQRRLRSVYGFDEVEIHSHESTIRVRVKRHGEELRPTDYCICLPRRQDRVD